MSAYGKELPNGKNNMPCKEVSFTMRLRAQNNANLA
jgi:hypothetical protein